MNTAVRDGAIVKNPCQRAGAGTDRAKERPVASPAASYRYLHAVDGRDAETAAALSNLAAHGDAARLPHWIVVKH